MKIKKKTVFIPIIWIKEYIYNKFIKKSQYSFVAICLYK